MKPTIVEHFAVEHAPFSTVVFEQSVPDRHETGPDAQPRLLPRETLHHVYLRDVATDHHTGPSRGSRYRAPPLAEPDVRALAHPVPLLAGSH